MTTTESTIEPTVGEMEEHAPLAEKEAIYVQHAVSGGIMLGSLLFPDYTAMMEGAARIAHSVSTIIEDQHLYQDLVFKDKGGGTKTSRHIKLEGWQVLMAHLGLTIMEEGVVEVVSPTRNGFEAAASLIRQDGLKIARMSGYCGFEEGWWTDKPPYALRSMALTRACAKAITATYRWIMKMEGYDGTPLEEMSEHFAASNERPKAEAVNPRSQNLPPMSLKQVADAVAEYAMAKYQLSREVVIANIQATLGVVDKSNANREMLPWLKLAVDITQHLQRPATIEEVNTEAVKQGIVAYEPPM